jgi:GTP cyclohydrolase I
MTVGAPLRALPQGAGMDLAAAERAAAAFLAAHTHLRPRGVGVVVEAEHTCMTLRGVRAAGTTTITSSVRGAVRDDPRSRAEFLALTTGGRHG